MSLEKLKTITDDIRKLLESDNWTIERLAYARKSDLTPYKGVGDVTAQRIIDEAGLVLAAGEPEEEAAPVAVQFSEPVQQPGKRQAVSVNIPTTPPERMSERVKRIRESN